MMFHRCTRSFLVLATSICLLSLVDESAARAWIGADGISFQADYVRLSGDSIVIRQDGETHVMPLHRLSADDRAWVQSAEACRKQRDWKTYRFDVIRGRYEKLEEGTVFIKTRTGRRTIPLRQLSEPDRRVITMYNEVPMVAGEAPIQPTADGGEDPSNSGNVQRVWTSTDGSKIVAEYRGLEGNKVVLFFKNREWRVNRNRFSAADQAYINARPKKAGVLMFDELDSEIPPHAETLQLANQQPDRLPSTRQASPRRPESSAAEVRRKMAEKREQQRQQIYQQAMRTTPERLSEPQHKTTIAAEAASRVREAEQALKARPTTRKPKPQPKPVTKMHYYECFACEKTIEARHELRVGDKCPHCGVKFDQLNNENGEVVDASTEITARRTFGLVKLVVFGVAGLGAFFGWVARQG